MCSSAAGAFATTRCCRCNHGCSPLTGAMSRSSKGFADFFPTAPSVLQQKRSKPPQGRKRPRSPTREEANLSPRPLAPHAPSQRSGEERRSTNGICNGHQRAEHLPIAPDDSDTLHGDLLSGVGSASSTSTTSSLFSMNQNQRGMKLKNTSASLTPLTHVDSSPPHSSIASPEWKPADGKAGPGEEPRNLTTARSATMEARNSFKQACSPITSQMQPFPERGEWKGVRVIYDPELDDTLNKDQRKGRKVKEVSFDARVGQSEISRSCPSEFVRLTERLL